MPIGCPCLHFISIALSSFSGASPENNSKGEPRDIKVLSGWLGSFFLDSHSRAASVPRVIRSWVDLGPHTLPRAEPLGSFLGQQEKSRDGQGRRTWRQ